MLQLMNSICGEQTEQQDMTHIGSTGSFLFIFMLDPPITAITASVITLMLLLIYITLWNATAALAPLCFTVLRSFATTTTTAIVIHHSLLVFCICFSLVSTSRWRTPTDRSSSLSSRSAVTTLIQSMSGSATSCTKQDSENTSATSTLAHSMTYGPFSGNQMSQWVNQKCFSSQTPVEVRQASGRHVVCVCRQQFSICRSHNKYHHWCFMSFWVFNWIIVIVV